MIDKKEEINNGAPIERDWDSAMSLWQEYANNYSEKEEVYEDFTFKIFEEKYKGIPIDISKELILQIAQLNDDMSILEDKLLDIARDAIDENVIWIHLGRRVWCKQRQFFQDLISGIKENRHDRYYEILGFCNSLAKRNKELWEEFGKYIDSLSVPYDSEEVRDGKKESDDSIVEDEFINPLNSLDYWTLDR